MDMWSDYFTVLNIRILQTPKQIDFLDPDFRYTVSDRFYLG